MPYANFCEKISTKFESSFAEISAEYNFDLGDEFEIALCKTLRVLLPERYGVCRGFLVTHDGDKAGDDIIIYDQERMPTIRMLENGQFSQKQEVPIEAVYAYIEAKHTLYINGKEGQSLSKAISQIEKVKKLTRPITESMEIDPYTKIKAVGKNQEYWPEIRNPIYAGIFARNVKIDSQSKDEKMCFEGLDGQLSIREHYGAIQPDFIIAGKNIVCLPSVEGQIESPFYVKGTTGFSPIKSNKKAVGVGLSSLSWAIDWMKLGKIYWPSIIASGLDLHIQNNEYLHEKPNK